MTTRTNAQGAPSRPESRPATPAATPRSTSMTTTAQEATGIDYAKLRDLAMEMNEAGLTVPAIARELELPRSTIYAWLPKGNDGSRAARMAQMREQGMTNKEIAARFNITRQRVSAILGPSTRRGRPADPRTAVRVRLSSRDVEQVVAVAERLGLRITSGAEAGRGSINALLEEIAAGNLRVAWRDGRTAYTRLIES